MSIEDKQFVLNTPNYELWIMNYLITHILNSK